MSDQIKRMSDEVATHGLLSSGRTITMWSSCLKTAWPDGAFFPLHSFLIGNQGIFLHENLDFSVLLNLLRSYVWRLPLRNLTIARKSPKWAKPATPEECRTES